MKKLIVGVAAALVLTTSNAVADGPYKRPPPTIAAPTYEPPPAPTWSGFYIGAGVGAGAVVHDVSVHDTFFDERLLRFNGVGGEGVLGTIIVGWDWQIGTSSVFGIFADYDFSDISTRLSVFDGMFGNSIDHRHSWSVGARLGWLANPSTLWYLTAGYTEARFDTAANFFLAGDSGDDRFSGYFVGAGLDTRLVNNWFLRLEYRFSQFDNETFFLDDEVTRVRIEPSMHTARLVLTYKFGGGYGWAMGR